MKKKIIIGLLMVSALSFGAGNNNSKTETGSGSGNNQKGTHQNQMFENLTEEQQDELIQMKEARRKSHYKESLDIKSKQIEVDKLLIEDKVDWKNVEKENKEVFDMKADQRIEGMKYKKDVEGKYGVTPNHKGKRNKGNKSNGNNQRGTHQNQMFENLTEEQQGELIKMKEARRKVHYKENLDIKSKQIEVDKLLIEDKVDWKTVEKENKDVFNMKADQKVEGMKYRKDVEEKYGVTSNHKGKGSKENKKSDGNNKNKGSKEGKN